MLAPTVHNELCTLPTPTASRNRNRPRLGRRERSELAPHGLRYLDLQESVYNDQSMS